MHRQAKICTICVLQLRQQREVIVAQGEGQITSFIILQNIFCMQKYFHPVVQSKVLLQINIQFPHAGLCEQMEQRRNRGVFSCADWVQM